MKYRFLNYFIALLLCCVWISCANISYPSGGPKDTRAPSIRERSLKDSAINFTGGTIEFEFDEMVQVKDIQNQLTIVPLLKTNPKVTAHKRKVKIVIPDSLLEKNTTYSITMGNAVQDTRENNAFENLQFTFSTGPYFDSLSLSGVIVEANTGRFDTASTILLYPAELDDSAFYRQKPMYVQKVDNGSFHFKNLPAKSFSVYALRDENKNLRYDILGERIAFMDKKINTQDTNQIKLYSFIAQDKPDTFKRKSFLQVRPSSNESKGNNKLTFTTNADTSNRTKRTFELTDSLFLRFDKPLKEMAASKIRLYQDSILDASAIVETDSLNKTISILTQWTEDAVYKVVLLKGFATDSSGMQAAANEFYFRTKRKSDYGYLTVLTTYELNDVIELMRSNTVIATKKVSDTLLNFSMLKPDNYQVRILHDKNGNGKWDSGSFFNEKKQPEIVELFPLDITIKANWENKIDLRVSRNKPKLK